MILRKMSCALVVLMCATITIVADAGPASAKGGLKLIDAVESPEDLVAVPGSSWVLASSYQNDGFVAALHRSNGRVVEAYPGAAPRADQDRELYGECSGPLAGGFRAHGMSLEPGRRGIHTLYVVRHNGREAVEVFRVDARGATPRLTWIGCVVAPESVRLNFNSVAAAPDGDGFAVTNYFPGEPSPDVWEWHPVTGWRQVPGSSGTEPNGLLISPNGKWYYVGGSATKTIYRISRGVTPVRVSSVQVGIMIDNLHFDDNGNILAAGFDAPSMQALVDCVNTGVCVDVQNSVLRVDPKLRKIERILSYTADDQFRLATSAVQVNRRTWVGQIGGDKIAVIKGR